jgi:hypothetical protein
MASSSAITSNISTSAGATAWPPPRRAAADLHQPFAGQQAQRFADGRARDAEALGQFLLVQVGAGLQAPGRHFLFDGFAELFGQALGRGHGEGGNEVPDAKHSAPAKEGPAIRVILECAP